MPKKETNEMEPLNFGSTVSSNDFGEEEAPFARLEAIRDGDGYWKNISSIVRHAILFLFNKISAQNNLLHDFEIQLHNNLQGLASKCSNFPQLAKSQSCRLDETDIKIDKLYKLLETVHKKLGTKADTADVNKALKQCCSIKDIKDLKVNLVQQEDALASKVQSVNYGHHCLTEQCLETIAEMQKLKSELTKLRETMSLVQERKASKNSVIKTLSKYISRDEFDRSMKSTMMRIKQVLQKSVVEISHKKRKFATTDLASDSLDLSSVPNTCSIVTKSSSALNDKLKKVKYKK